jgi:hypothetical protein
LVFSLCLFLCVCVCLSVSLISSNLTIMSNFSTLLYKTNCEGDTENISQEKLRRRQRKHFLRVFLLGDLDRRNISKRFSSWRSWRKEHSQEFFFLKILTETFARVLFLKILTETFPRVFFLRNLLRISAPTQCTASENEEEEVRLFFRMLSTDESTHPYRAFDLIKQQQISSSS